MTDTDRGAAGTEPTPSTDPGPLILTQHVGAPPELVYEYFTDQEKMLRWMGTAVQAEARPGGVFSMNATGTDIASGAFVELDPPTRVVFTFGWEGSDTVAPGSTTVTVTLTEADDRTTMVELRHDGLPGGPEDQHNEGWTYFLGRLAIAATGGDPGRPTHGA